jgi:flagellar biosynthesis/type III secretory pathway protein FliH
VEAILYNASPSGKTAKMGAPRGAPVWQPLKPLKPVELQNAGFVQENYLRPKSTHFSLWTVEEQVAAGKIADATEDLRNADGSDSENGEALGLTGEDASNSDLNSSASVSGLDSEAIERIKKEAYDRGVADGKKLQQEATAAEVQEAETESLTALADKANQLLVNIEQGVAALQENPASWNEPLKRLALHLAEQLTLTELSISASGIQNMIDRCIETLDVQTASSVVVELNPNDMALLQNHKAAPGEKTHQWRLVADSHLLPGSVRVRADDAVVSDLIEHRLETLAQALLQDTKPWQAQTAFQPERLAARRGKAETVEDALPRDVSPMPINLAELDLPDLDLSDDKPSNDDTAEGLAND